MPNNNYNGHLIGFTICERSQLDVDGYTQSETELLSAGKVLSQKWEPGFKATYGGYKHVRECAVGMLRQAYDIKRLAPETPITFVIESFGFFKKHVSESMLYLLSCHGRVVDKAIFLHEAEAFESALCRAGVEEINAQ